MDGFYKSVDEVSVKAIPSVYGAQTSSVDVLLDEIFERLDALNLLVE